MRTPTCNGDLLPPRLTHLAEDAAACLDWLMQQDMPRAWTTEILRLEDVLARVCALPIDGTTGGEDHAPRGDSP